MDILIAGAGTVGYSLARTLSYRHNVTVIDKDQQKLDRLDEDIDILVLKGDVEDPKTYRSLLIDRIDLFIAVTDSDEANLLATLIVEDEVTVSRKIVRLKNDAFLKSHVLHKLSIDHAVFPDITTANKVKALFTFPKANNVKVFHQCRQKLISIRVASPKREGMRIAQLSSQDVQVVGLERQKDFIIPSQDTQIEPHDLLYLFGNVEVIEKLSLELDTTLPTSIRKVVIFGANRLAQKIAKALLEKPLEIKMIEKEMRLCKEADLFLEGKVQVINAAYDDHRLFEEEGIKYADMVIAAGWNDEKNIVKCVEAKEYGIAKVVAINNDKSYYHLMHKMGVVVVRGSKAGAHYAILEKIASSTVVTQRLYCGGTAVLFMRKIYPDSTLIGRKIKAMKGAYIRSMLIRQSALLSLNEAAYWQEADTVVVFGHIDEKEKMEQWIYTL